MYRPQITLHVDEANDSSEQHHVIITVRYQEDESENMVAVNAINDIRKAYQDTPIEYIHTDDEGTHFVLVEPDFVTRIGS